MVIKRLNNFANYTLAQLLFLQLPIAVDSQAQMSDHQAAADKILQTFCQICLRAVTSERDVSLLLFYIVSESPVNPLETWSTTICKYNGPSISGRMNFLCHLGVYHIVKYGPGGCV